MYFKQLFQNRLDNKEQLTRQDVNDIQQSIIDHMIKLDRNEQSLSQHYELALYEADNASRILEEEGYNPDTVDYSSLPAYLSDKIGDVDAPPEEYKKTAEAEYNDAIGIAEGDRESFYSDVYDLQHFHLDEPNPDVFGWRDLQQNQPVIVRQDTIEMLGQDYDDYCNRRFHERTEEILKEHTSEKTAMSLTSGINLEKKAEPATPSYEQEIALADQRKKDNAKNPHVYPQPGYTNTIGKDGYSFDEKDDHAEDMDLTSRRAALASNTLGDIGEDSSELDKSGDFGDN